MRNHLVAAITRWDASDDVGLHEAALYKQGQNSASKRVPYHPAQTVFAWQINANQRDDNPCEYIKTSN